MRVVPAWKTLPKECVCREAGGVGDWHESAPSLLPLLRFDGDSCALSSALPGAAAPIFIKNPHVLTKLTRIPVILLCLVLTGDECLQSTSRGAGWYPPWPWGFWLPLLLGHSVVLRNSGLVSQRSEAWPRVASSLLRGWEGSEELTGPRICQPGWRWHCP